MGSRSCNYCDFKNTKRRHKNNLRMESKDGWDTFFLIKYEGEEEGDNGFVCSMPTGSYQKCGC